MKYEVEVYRYEFINVMTHVFIGCETAVQQSGQSWTRRWTWTQTSNLNVSLSVTLSRSLSFSFFSTYKMPSVRIIIAFYFKCMLR